MLTFREKLADPSRFLIGVELVSTRGTMEDQQARQTRAFASDLVSCDPIDWVSITDNAGGNPQLSPMALGKPILYAGKEVLIHLSCKDFNRSGLESAAWELASEGFHNILALSGDYPAAGYHGRGKPVFDIDSVGLLTMLDEMNRGLARPKVSKGTQSGRFTATDFFPGAVATNFKKHENEVVPQLLKLDKKIQCGAKFIIAPIGYDARKSDELLQYTRRRQSARVPLIGNVFLLTMNVVKFFRRRTIPGVVITDSLFALCEKHAQGPDKGAAFFRQLAAKQLAIFRGLGFAGGYIGGVHQIEEVRAILELERSFSPDDWKLFAREIQHPERGEFYYFARDPKTTLADSARLEPSYAASLKTPRPMRRVNLQYRFSKWVHDSTFKPGTWLHMLGQKIYRNSKDSFQGPRSLRVLEHVTKSAMFGCKDCGDCSLPDIAYLCPESQCAKNQRNGPCGGTRDGKCEVHDFECIWARAYDRLKDDGHEQHMLDHAPVIQDESLRGTSSWANALLGRDHTARTAEKRAEFDAIKQQGSGVPMPEPQGLTGANGSERLTANETSIAADTGVGGSNGANEPHVYRNADRNRPEQIAR
jgi:methylenetetrahydrofolate reductase (NADPH)